MNKQQKTGLLLIIIGGLILLNQFQIFDLSAKNIVAVTSLLLGMLLLKKSLTSPERKGLLGGSFFLIWGIMLLFFNFNSEMGRTLFFGQLFLSLGLANLIYFLFSGVTRATNFFVFVLFAAIGGTMIAAYYGLLDVWHLEEILDTYWPVILILLGIFILIDSYRNRNRELEEETDDTQTMEN